MLYVFVGFFAQMIDGAMGMAYGVSSNTFLLSIGVPPAAASASVHMAEVVTTGVSGKFSVSGGDAVSHSSPFAAHGFGPAAGP